MEGSEEESGWERSSTSRGINTTKNKIAASIAEEEEEDHAPGSCTDEIDRRAGYSADHLRRRDAGDDDEGSEISLRLWLDRPGRSVDLLECLHIFRQVVEMVSIAHSQGIAVSNVRPSCFIMSTFNRVSFIESASCSSSGSDSFGNGAGSEEKDDNPCTTSRDQNSESSCLRSCAGRDGGEVADRKKSFPLKRVLLMEYNWYASPEESTGISGSFASDIYKLGVLLFELFCPTSSFDEKLRTMSNLRHRVLPPPLLLKFPKEASFCLWLLHPQPSTRPKLSEVLQSEFLNEPRDSLEERESAIKLRQDIEEQEMLLEFLLRLQQSKQETAKKLNEMVFCLSSDIEETMKKLEIVKKDSEDNSSEKKTIFSPYPEEDSFSSGSRKRIRCKTRTESLEPETQQKNQEIISSKSSRLMKNFKKLEDAYLATRCKMTSARGRNQNGGSEWISPFLEGLRKYLAFGKLKVRADLKQGDLLNSSNLVCSLGFDRDKELFATAGVNRKIKIFECDVVLNDDRDVHYPVVEMISRSKLSSICWNGYIKNQIASSDFEGVVQVWDVARSKVFVEMREHERRVWAVDFSITDPTKLASGSDDGSVKLWNINQSGSTGTIKTKANVCSVQFPPDSAWTLAVGSADHRIYLYDLRTMRTPLCTMIGHTKTVSYVKFVDSSTLVSASTDNSLKLWDISSSSSRVINDSTQTYAGHTNVKNFVGLSISDGYIATGSETNEVFVYHKAFPMPVLSYKFSSADAVTGRELEDGGQFISCVCWRGQSHTLVAANSIGNVKILEMV